MLRIRALNHEASSDEDTPVIRREAQEEIALELYNKALRLQAQGDFTESVSILLKLIQENIPLLENNGGLPKSMSNLKFACNVNIGNAYLKLNRVNDALETYLLASELDGTDVTLWYKIGNLSIKEDKFGQSVFAFAKGLECSESHWPCLDKIISVLFAIKDTIACLEYISKAFTLDPDYTKGLVLRRQIYTDNPATEDYYKLYNPDSIWDPPLDSPIEEEDEKKYLEEVQILCDRINDIQKSLAPKPLQTIALPKPLTDYTWLCLTETITYIHQYLTDNGMSHFSQFDMSKSMSHTEESAFKFPLSDQTCDPKITEDNTPKINGEVTNNEEKMANEQIAERRFSQTSETAMEVQEVTPVQTDNDEEQNVEIDNEEQYEVVETRERGRPRGSKRKRDLLSDLQTWGWYSRRKLSKKAKEKDFTVEDAFERIIPQNLLPYRIDPEKFTNFEDSMNTMDLYNLYMGSSTVNYLSPIHSPKSVTYDQYFGTEKERDDVQEFWTKFRECCDAVVLIKDLVFHLSKLWHYKWPKPLVFLYIKAYSMFREHYDCPQVFCGGHTFEELRDDALASILYSELCVFSSDNKETLPPMLIGYMRLISGWQEKWLGEYPSFFIRVFWLQSHIFRKENNNDLAINALQLIQEAIEEEGAKRKEKYLLSLPNCFKYGLVSMEIIDKIIKHLEMIHSLATVENLFNTEQYKEAAAILKQTFNGGPCPQVGRMGRPAQLGILIHSLWYTDMTDCFIWTEECLNEGFEQSTKFHKDQDKWEKVVQMCLAVLYEIIKTDTVIVIDHLAESNRARIIQNLCKVISKQLNSDGSTYLSGCVTPWILLHFVLQREEQREYSKKRNLRGKKEKNDSDFEDYTDNTLPSSIAILFSGHEFLGPKGWCMRNQGELLHFIIDTLVNKLDTPVFERVRDKIDINIEQAMFCLYQHPSKKNKVSRHLADHNVDPLPLSWERASQLFEFYGPDCLPEVNSYKNASISADLEQLFKRIIALVPANNAPQHHLPKIMDYIHGKTDKIMEAIDFPHKVKAIYYLIGDFYFKQKEFSKCIKYFQMDLCINPLRLDSWACLSLSYAAQLDAKLNHCEKFKTETEFLDKAKYASICFTKALEICPDHLMLWIECGTFQYTSHSYCSRILKYESENLSMEKFEFLENQKNSYLDSSGNSFEKAIAIYELEDTNEADERWLQYYILGKIAEKKQKEPNEYLQYYLTARTLLEENNAEYPEKIHYNNPQHLSVEALELHYRIHASVLKYLELHEGKDIPNTLGAFFKKCLSTSKYLKKPPPVSTTAPTPESASAQVPEPSSAQVPEPSSVTAESGAASDPQSASISEPVSSTAPDIPQKPANSSCSFQEQFLNSLNKLGLPDKNETKTTVVPKSKSDKEIDAKIVDLPIINDKKEEVIDLDQHCDNKKTEDNKNVVQKEDSHTYIMISDSDEDVKTESKETEMEVTSDTVSIKMESEKINFEDSQKEVGKDKNTKSVEDNNGEIIDVNNEQIVEEKIKCSGDKNFTEGETKQDNLNTVIAEDPKELSNKIVENQEQVQIIKIIENGACNDLSINNSSKNTLEEKSVTDFKEQESSQGNKLEIDNIESSPDIEMQVDNNESLHDNAMKIENKESPKDTAAVELISEKREIKDVQTMLDEMMMQTMKETEENRNELDSDLSGTEKVEVVLKDEPEFEDNKVDTNPETNHKPQKVNPTGGDSDIDNKKVAIEVSSSGSSASSSSTDSSDSDSDDDDDGDSSDTSSSSSSDASNEFMSHSEISHLIDRCILGLEICITRLTQNYKALYRLTHVYFNYKSKKDLTKCKHLLLGEYKCKDGTVVSGLFSDRKPNNFFNGIWRIPSTEIDRPGSLSAHMSRCLSLLMQILRTTNDNKTLIDLSVQLRKIPEPDKIYIKDTERLAFSDQAVTMCIQSLRAQIKHVPNMSNPQIAKILQEIFKIYQRLQKHVPGKETPFANLLVEVYRKFIKEKIPENINVLELAIKFCLQNKAAEKHRISGVTKPLPVTGRGPSVSSGAHVMPSPQTISQPQPAILKRPGTSRPRGRPPLSKPSTAPRAPRPKSPSAAALPKTYAWQKSLMDQSYAYEYLKHYQDELIKQYSQNLSIAQLTQLSQILTQGHINNPLTATAITSQMLAQSGILNSNLLKQINSAGNISQNTSAQLMDSLTQLNPNLKKQLGVDQALSSLTADQLKLLGTLTPKQPGTASQSKPSTPHPATASSNVYTNKQSKPSTSFQRPNVAGSAKAVVIDPSKNKPMNVTSPPPKNLQPSQVFKEPVNKVSIHEDKTAKDLMKDRPNISITPVAVSLPPPPSVSPNFMRPTSTSPSSGGKTLQEKLAEKKKEQQTKQMKSNGEAEKRQTDALMKSLNIPSIPSSLTVSPAQPVPPTQTLVKTPDTTATMLTYQKPTQVPIPKYPLDIHMQQSSGLKLPKDQIIPSSLTVSKASSSPLGTPTFPAESGISISQVSSDQPTKITDSHSSNDTKPNIPAGSRVIILSRKDESTDETKNLKTKSECASKVVNIEQKLSRNIVTNISKNVNTNDNSKQSARGQAEELSKKMTGIAHMESFKNSGTSKPDYSKIFSEFDVHKVRKTYSYSESNKKLEALSKSGLSVSKKQNVSKSERSKPETTKYSENVKGYSKSESLKKGESSQNSFKKGESFSKSEFTLANLPNKPDLKKFEKQFNKSLVKYPENPIKNVKSNSFNMSDFSEFEKQFIKLEGSSKYAINDGINNECPSRTDAKYTEVSKTEDFKTKPNLDSISRSKEDVPKQIKKVESLSSDDDVICID